MYINENLSVWYQRDVFFLFSINIVKDILLCCFKFIKNQSEMENEKERFSSVSFWN